jgi:peptidoglycan/LPS O-acetylase OafA/YrhL
MLFASVHLLPYWTIPAALASAAGLIWYWMQLGRPNVPVSRRRIRRISTAIMFLSLPLMVYGLSFADRITQPRQYIIAWTMAMFMMLIVIAIACLDGINSLLLHQRQAHEEVTETARELRRALRRRAASRDWPGDDSPNGKEHHA